MATLETPAAAGQKQVYGAVAEFDQPEALLAAIREARRLGYRRMEAYTPFPVHGLDQAMGARRSRLGWIVLACGALGTATALWLQWWTGTVGYPLLVGGKPLFAFEFSIPVTFELTVLFAAFGAVIGMLLLNGLPRLCHPVFNYQRFHGATDDRFLLVIEKSDPAFDEKATPLLLQSLGSSRTEVIEA